MYEYNPNTQRMEEISSSQGVLEEEVEETPGEEQSSESQGSDRSIDDLIDWDDGGL